MKNKQKGITLIALVITIIVLLILAGVTINLTLGENGIFKIAEQAAKNYTNAQDKEMADIGNFDNTVAGTIDNVTGKNGERLSSKAQPGDYVKYVPTAKSFSMTPEQTGRDANQDYNTGSYKDAEGNPGLWQVLYNDDVHGLQIISANLVGKLAMGKSNIEEEKTQLAYNEAVNTLNSFSSNYVDTRYAVSGRSVGSNPINPKDILDLNNPEHTVKFPFKYKDTYESGYKIPDDNYDIDCKAMQKATAQNPAGIISAEDWYMLASRSEKIVNEKDRFSIRYVRANGVVGEYAWIEYGEGDYVFPVAGENLGVRPVITLKSGIRTNNGDGSSTSPFELVAQ